MNETVIGDRSTRIPMPIEVAVGFADLMRRPRARSAIIWREQCSECDYPAWFTTSAILGPRALT